jgi:hypothetical protein
MTPKEKAVELIDLFTFNCKECDNAKISALVAIDEILFALSFHSDTELGEAYWKQVKQEIEKI